LNRVHHAGKATTHVGTSSPSAALVFDVKTFGALGMNGEGLAVLQEGALP
jgi:hypothetical protein